MKFCAMCKKNESTGSPLGCSHADAQQHTHAMSSPRQSKQNNNKQEAYSNRQSAVHADLQEERIQTTRTRTCLHTLTHCVLVVCV